MDMDEDAVLHREQVLALRQQADTMLEEINSWGSAGNSSSAKQV